MEANSFGANFYESYIVCVKHFFFADEHSIVPAHFVEKTISTLHWIALTFYICVDLFLDSLFSSMFSCVYSFAKSCCLDYCCFMKVLRSWVWVLQLCSSVLVWLFQNFCFSLWTLEPIHLYLSGNLLGFDRNCIDSIDQIERTNILTIICLPIYNTHYLSCDLDVLWILP